MPRLTCLMYHAVCSKMHMKQLAYHQVRHPQLRRSQHRTSSDLVCSTDPRAPPNRSPRRAFSDWVCRWVRPAPRNTAAAVAEQAPPRSHRSSDSACSLSSRRSHRSRCRPSTCIGRQRRHPGDLRAALRRHVQLHRTWRLLSTDQYFSSDGSQRCTRHRQQKVSSTHPVGQTCRHGILDMTYFMCRGVAQHLTRPPKHRHHYQPPHSCPQKGAAEVQTVDVKLGNAGTHTRTWAVQTRQHSLAVMPLTTRGPLHRRQRLPLPRCRGVIA
mmetsp:Transcript_91012/g.161200  ORF Transcript_91012/g.161200 Transcript_91012/m.161200 type:complete len:269 (+) Transcript_91012:557-1363(+)